MRVKDFELEVLVNDKPVTEYSHKGMTFLEGRRGSEFKLRFHNKTNKRVLVVPSIDGVSTLNGQAATVDSPGFAVNAYKTIDIKGWTVNNETGAAFVFFDKEGNTQKIYAQSATGSVKNAGVIGVLVFAEKEEPKVETKVVHHHHNHYPTYYPPYVRPYWERDIMWLGGATSVAGSNEQYSSAVDRAIAKAEASGGLTESVKTLGMAPQQDMVLRSLNIPMDNALCDSADNMILCSSAMAPQASMSSVASAQRTTASNMQKTKSTNMHVETNTQQVQGFDMGTGWGKKVDFKINQVTFNKGELAATLQVFYESRKSLERRGIEVRKPRTTPVEELPQAFSGIGCTPPAGWKG